MKDGDGDGDRKVKTTAVKHATFAEPEKQRDGSVGDSDDDTRALEVRMFMSIELRQLVGTWS